MSSKRIRDRVRDRLLDQDRHLALDAGEPGDDMELVGRGDDRAVEPDLVEHALVVLVVRNPVLACQVSAAGLGSAMAAAW